MFKMTIVSRAPVPKGSKIIVANHPTTSDPFILTSLTNGQAAVLIKNILFDIPLFGDYLNWAGHIPVITGQGHIAFERSLNLLKRGVTLIVFIEGDLTEITSKKSKPKTGAVRLAMESGVPIVPIGISVKEQNIKMLKSTIGGIKEEGRWYLNGPYALTIGKPLTLTGTTDNRVRVRKLSEWLTLKIAKLKEKSDFRIKQFTH